MKRRGLRVTLIAGAIGLAVVASVVAFNWGAVRDHLEAWHFQLTRKTQIVMEREGSMREDEVQLVRAFPDRPVILDPDQLTRLELTRETLEADGFRVLEQRFPRKAYVLIRDEEPR